MVRRKTRVKDKWREKKWINVLAPDSFNNIQIAYIPITNEENSMGRVIEVTLFDILKGDTSQYQYKMYFQINKIENDKAVTIFKRYEYAKEFLRSLVRRGSSKINFIYTVKTKDGYVFRIKMIALSNRQLNTSRKHALRVIAKNIMEKTIRNFTLSGRRKMPNKNTYIEIEPEIIEINKILTKHKLTREQLIDIGILIGTDFNPHSFRGIGAKTALKLIQQYSKLENIPKINEELTKIKFNDIRKIFLKPNVADINEINFREVNYEKITEYLINERSFSSLRIKSTMSKMKINIQKRSQSLEKWFN